MDRVLSTRVDESVVERITSLARQLKTSKKSILERAITSFAKQLDSQGDLDVFGQTSGAWDRRETPEKTAERARVAFRSSMQRRRR